MVIAKVVFLKSTRPWSIRRSLFLKKYSNGRNCEKSIHRFYLNVFKIGYSQGLFCVLYSLKSIRIWGFELKKNYVLRIDVWTNAWNQIRFSDFPHNFFLMKFKVKFICFSKYRDANAKDDIIRFCRYFEIVGLFFMISDIFTIDFHQNK